MQQAKPLFWFSHMEEKSDTSKDVSLFVWASADKGKGIAAIGAAVSADS
ncbi:hypothetical protein [Burkholderia ambifaria]|nr:hypothetical protein [Burkholderia ambifaria]MBR8348727.1 hypothetical protein [Burkholderia ambifaria]